MAGRRQPGAAQRRGVPPGNLTARVSRYYYDADGTFDTSSGRW
jgi:hypothetical protein